VHDISLLVNALLNQQDSLALFTKFLYKDRGICFWFAKEQIDWSYCSSKPAEKV